MVNNTLENQKNLELIISAENLKATIVVPNLETARELDYVCKSNHINLRPDLIFIVNNISQFKSLIKMKSDNVIFHPKIATDADSKLIDEMVKCLKSRKKRKILDKTSLIVSGMFCLVFLIIFLFLFIFHTNLMNRELNSETVLDISLIVTGLVFWGILFNKIIENR